MTEYGEFISGMLRYLLEVKMSVASLPQGNNPSALLLQKLTVVIFYKYRYYEYVRGSAQFQAGVGCEPLEMIGVDIANRAMPL